MPPSIILEIRKYIKARIKIEPHGFSTPCWQWESCTNRQGYAQGWVSGKTVRMARISHEAFTGEIPEEHQIDHLCRNRRCVNPAHLEAVTAAENKHYARHVNQRTLGEAAIFKLEQTRPIQTDFQTAPQTRRKPT